MHVAGPGSAELRHVSMEDNLKLHRLAAALVDPAE
jgi:hypothetical protein